MTVSLFINLKKATGMISEKNISDLYRKYSRRPKSADQLNFALLFESVHNEHAVAVDGTKLVIKGLDASSPFHSIPIKCIHAIVNYDDSVAIVLHSSIVFINKADECVNVHINFKERSLLQRIFG